MSTEKIEDAKTAIRNRAHDIQEYGYDMDHFVIYLQGVEENPDECNIEPGVEYRMANRFIRNLDTLTAIDSERPIIISMKTNGGDWNEGMAIYDAIIAAPNPVTIVNYTHARSMSSIIMCAANKRVMMPHSTFMIHMGTWGDEGTWKQCKSAWNFEQRTEHEMLDIYVERLKGTPGGKCNSWSKKRIREWLVQSMHETEEVYFTAEQAVKVGFADQIFTDWETVTDYTEEQEQVIFT
jgi:ATP-dependent protease ClpP protease subunit